MSAFFRFVFRSESAEGNFFRHAGIPSGLLRADAALGGDLRKMNHFPYFSDGPSRKFAIDGRTLEFKHISGKESHLGNSECELFIQAVKELGELATTGNYKRQILSILTPKLKMQVEKALPLLTEKRRTILRTLLQ